MGAVTGCVGCYFMLIMDSVSIFQYVEFLGKKIADITLNMLKKFLAETVKGYKRELYTGTNNNMWY